jgi:hypothetical protein
VRPYWRLKAVVAVTDPQVMPMDYWEQFSDDENDEETDDE